eukprot:c28366_g1_i3 orf=930-1943(-)
MKVQFPSRSRCSELKYFGFHFLSPCITCPAVRLRRRSFDVYTVWNLRRRLGWRSSADQRRIVSAELKSEVHVAMRSCGSCAKEGFVLDSEEEFSPVSERSGREEYLVINFYQLVDISSPDEEVARHRSFLQGKDICGRIYVSYQGINAQYSGPSKLALAYAEWVKEDPRFADMIMQVSLSPSGHAFSRLKLRYKPCLVQLGGGTLHLPLTEPSLRAIQLSPRQWRERLCSSVTLEPNHGRGDIANCKSNLQIGTTFVLDVRNGYEWDVGHFRGTHRPRVDCFKNTEFSVLDREGNGNDLLLRVDKESTNILMYCTGGIRCDVYSTYLRCITQESLIK